MKTILIDAVDCFVSSEGKIFKEIQDLLDTYKNRKIILTNASLQKYSDYNLDKMPYEVFTLEHNPEKTDPKYYEMMLSHFNLSSEEVIYVEHNSLAVESAKSVGIKSYWYDTSKKDLKKLKEFIDNNL